MAAGDLTTLATFKTWANISAVNTDDALLTAAITRLSAAVVNYINRNALLSASYDELYHGVAGDYILARNVPVTAVSAITVSGITVPAAGSVQPLNGFTFDDYGFYCLGGYSFTKGRLNVSVQYTAGFAAVPSDIEEACLEWLNVIYRERERPGHSSKSLGGETVSFDIKDMPARVKTLLNPFRRTVWYVS